MEIDRAMRSADNRVVAVMALIFLGLVFLIGIASNDVPGDIEMTESSFDVAPPVVTLPPPSDTETASPRLAHLSPVAQSAAPAKGEPWFADEAANGMRPDAPR